MAYVQLARTNCENVQHTKFVPNLYTFSQGLSRNFVVQNFSNIIPIVPCKKALTPAGNSLVEEE